MASQRLEISFYDKTSGTKSIVAYETDGDMCLRDELFWLFFKDCWNTLGLPSVAEAVKDI